MNLFENDDLWLCTTCMNCLRVCPKEVNMMKIMPAIREQVVLNGSLPGEIQDMLQNVSEYGNPMGESPRKRPRWTKGLENPPETFPRKMGLNRLRSYGMSAIIFPTISGDRMRPKL